MNWLRLKIARALDRLMPNACWATLVTWALGYHGMREVDWRGRQCRRDCAERGSCWCCKMHRKDGDE